LKGGQGQEQREGLLKIREAGWSVSDTPQTKTGGKSGKKRKGGNSQAIKLK